MRRIFALLAVLALVPLLPAAPAAPELAAEPLGIPEPRLAPAPPAVVLPYMPGDDVLVPVNNNQNEFSIAANPLDPDHLVAGSNDYGRGDAWAGVYVSRDGGAHWTTGYIPQAAIYPVSGDAALTFDKAGNVYYIGIAFNRGNNNGGANAIFVSKSTNGGATWVTSYPFSSPTNAAFHDKPYVGADPVTGALYLTYTHFGAGGGITFSKSLDGGATWSAKKVIGGGQFSLPIAGTNGEIYVTWAGSGAKFARSLDGGATWTVTTPMQMSIGSLPVGFRVFTYPVMDVVRGGLLKGRIYLAAPFAPVPTVESDLRVIASDDGGRTWLPPEVIARPGIQFMPWMAITPEGVVGLAYMDTVLSPNTWGESGGVANPVLTQGTTLSQSISIRNEIAPVWASSITTDEPSDAMATLFWGDYQGLAATSKGFHPAFGDARGQAPCNCVAAALLDFGTMRVDPSPLP